ncbi:hypothetical protein TRFO_15076 [Tritrichomonas foetus]|uniref:Uncharacterized protein n=1 Tax=Tritrichomonas foetus TaxID=1144522 RepID=A0A1J4KTS1_9EUKA|nr:hypothetical protein TRFO_15076 [Tritrichomonas foetus]|eukprot:OHT14538.1 hypothetical protein TRFO_15076 [Tritrichomonas foetus]
MSNRSFFTSHFQNFMNLKSNKILQFSNQISADLCFFESTNYVFEFERDRFFDQNHIQTTASILLDGPDEKYAPTHPIYTPSKTSIKSSFKEINFIAFDEFSAISMEPNKTFYIPLIRSKNSKSPTFWYFYTKSVGKLYDSDINKIFEVREIPPLSNKGKLVISVNGEEREFRILSKSKVREFYSFMKEGISKNSQAIFIDCSLTANSSVSFSLSTSSFNEISEANPDENSTTNDSINNTNNENNKNNENNIYIINTRAILENNNEASHSNTNSNSHQNNTQDNAQDNPQSNAQDNIKNNISLNYDMNFKNKRSYEKLLACYTTFNVLPPFNIYTLPFFRMIVEDPQFLFLISQMKYDKDTPHSFYQTWALAAGMNIKLLLPILVYMNFKNNRQQTTLLRGNNFLASLLTALLFLDSSLIEFSHNMSTIKKPSEEDMLSLFEKVNFNGFSRYILSVIYAEAKRVFPLSKAAGYYAISGIIFLRIMAKLMSVNVNLQEISKLMKFFNLTDKNQGGSEVAEENPHQVRFKKLIYEKIQMPKKYVFPVGARLNMAEIEVLIQRSFDEKQDFAVQVMKSEFPSIVAEYKEVIRVKPIKSFFDESV